MSRKILMITEKILKEQGEKIVVLESLLSKLQICNDDLQTNNYDLQANNYDLQASNYDLQTENTNLKKRCEQYSQAYDNPQQQLSDLLRYRFGKKSERYVEIDSKQLTLPGYVESEIKDAEENEPKVEIAAHSRKRKNNANKDLPVRVEIIPVSEENRKCECCGKNKEVISYDTKKLLHHEPAVFEIIEQRREVVACSNKCCSSKIITAPAPKHILPKVKASEEFLSFLVVSKLEDRQPLYHLEQQLAARHEINCSRQTMARWLIDLKEPLQPIYNLLKDEVIGYDIASCDATTLQVLKEPGRSPETKSYVYCVRGGPPDKSVILYDYNAKLHKQFVDDWFADFEGYLHVDGDNFFDLVGERASLVNCNAHARRKYEAIVKSAKKPGLAKRALKFYKDLYKIERDAKELTAEERYNLRQEKSKPIIEEFKQWLVDNYPTVLPASPLGKAMKYCINLWSGLTRFLDDGRLLIDNNHTEREIKPMVIARKNFLFSDTVAGAQGLCLHFSLIRTAKLHGIDPYRYYVKLLKNIPYCTTAEDYETLLPWNIKTTKSLPSEKNNL
jgi:transposase